MNYINIVKRPVEQWEGGLIYLKGQFRDLKKLYGGLDWVINRWFIIYFHI